MLEIKDVISKLREYSDNHNDTTAKIAIVAPAYGDNKMLRVYMNGGNLGRIALSRDRLTTGIGSAYCNKCHDIRVTEAFVLDPESTSTEEERRNAIVSLKYIEYVIKATSAYAAKSRNSSDKERTIETLLLDYNNQKYGNAAIDMELQYSAKDHFGWTRFKEGGKNYPSKMVYRKHNWYNEELFANSSDTKSPRIDMLVLNDAGVGFVELKVDNENCGNLESHIHHMEYILSHKDVFLKDVNRRIAVLEKYDLLMQKMKFSLDAWKSNHNIWCAILFVGDQGHITGAKDMMKKYRTNNNILCAFIGKNVIKQKKVNLNSTVFVSVADFIKDTYCGVF